MLIHKSYINLAIPVILRLLLSLYDLTMKSCQICSGVPLFILLENPFLAYISKTKPQEVYVAS